MTRRINYVPPVTRQDRARAYADLMLSDHGLLRYFFNRPYQISDEMWRSAQPSPGQVENLASQGIKTIINLRGPSEIGAYRLEREACERLGVVMRDFRVLSRDVPHKDVLHEAQDLLENIAYPALMHCKSGADRAGIMSALYLLIRKKTPIEVALKQLDWRFGHFRQANTGILDHFLESYRDYNAHTPTPFMTWVDEVYDPEAIKLSFRSEFLPTLIVDKLLRRE